MTGPDIRRRRLRLGISRDRLAHQLGVPADLVEAWEAGASNVSVPAALTQILREEELQFAGKQRADFGDAYAEHAMRR